MKIGVDIDGTITAYPEFFTAFCKAMRKDGHEIHIITGGKADAGPWTEQARIDILAHFNIEYDYLHRCIYPDTESLSKSKAIKCKELGIDMIFDDQPEYVFYLQEAGIPTCIPVGTIKINQELADKGGL